MARVQIFALGSEWPEFKSLHWDLSGPDHYLPAIFFLILMKIGECVRLGVMRKAIIGIFKEKNVL